ncbi:Mut7-C RNAse domain-containing protein [Pseudonocardia lutea]|uniref:Mut7-C RNAse domain-containing protein n=1 Tax=Pseudonocardia lutea TaxID=2172015 RepID=A0ABW1IF26_9PSEU
MPPPAQDPSPARSGPVVVRTDPGLWFLLSRERRRDRATVPWDGDATLGHVVQSLGVPLTEVGGLRLDGRPASPQERPVPGAELEILPVQRPQEVPGATGFLLDVGLGTLARRLRVLGIDAAYRNDAADAELVREGAAQHRIVLTQDRGLLMRRALWAGAHVAGDRPDDQLADVLDRFAPPLAPSTRCTACNGELAPVAAEEVAGGLQPGTRRSYAEFARCRSCGRVYWHGAHGKGLQRIVEAARAVVGRRSAQPGR